MKKIIAALLATIAFATALTGCGGNKNNSKNETSAHSSATSENSKNEGSKSDDKNKVESKADSMTDDAERNGRVRDDDGIIGNEDLLMMRFFNEKRAFLSARFILWIIY